MVDKPTCVQITRLPEALLSTIFKILKTVYTHLSFSGILAWRRWKDVGNSDASGDWGHLELWPPNQQIPRMASESPVQEECNPRISSELQNTAQKPQAPRQHVAVTKNWKMSKTHPSTFNEWQFLTEYIIFSRLTFSCEEGDTYQITSKRWKPEHPVVHQCNDYRRLCVHKR